MELARALSYLSYDPVIYEMEVAYSSLGLNSLATVYY